ncbi:hypothetical protein EV182_005885 [Spiromyces aspiralis]|uniref:Uncharacterized protein n=1 Tax=Spiromyces aspiralis TaxID=68401 RepID=A0ACC1HA08_9FUNG|nr:hypothetical protein EV182_005885 [Spiromyces aspiralis]
MLNNAYKSAFVRPMGDTDVYGRPMRWVECFLPMSNEHARSVRQRLDPVSSAASQVGSDTIEFEKHYEYDLPLNDSTTKQDQCLITFHKSRDARRAERGRPVIEARYVPIRWRGMLKRRRQYQKQQYYMQESDLPRTTHLRITGRELDDDEVQERDLKMTELSSNGPASPRPIEELGEKDETLLPLDVSGEAGAGEDGDNVDGGSHYVD